MHAYVCMYACKSIVWAMYVGCWLLVVVCIEGDQRPSSWIKLHKLLMRLKLCSLAIARLCYVAESNANISKVKSYVYSTV